MGQSLTPEELDQVSAPAHDVDYEKMGALELGQRALSNLPSSVWESAKGIGTAIAHPIQTGEALVDVGYGLGSMAYGAAGFEQDPTAKAENERLARAVVEPYTSIPAFKKELAENPAGPLSLLLPAAGGALTKTGEVLNAVSRAGGIAEKVGSGLTKAGRGVEIATSAVDPARAGLEAARGIRKFGSGAVADVMHHLTGSPDVVFEQAFKAGAERGANAQTLRDGFNQFYHGNGNVVDLSQDIDKAVTKLREDASNKWINDRGTVTGAATAPIDYSGVRGAFDTAWKNFGGHPRTKTLAFPDARAALRDAYKLVREYTQYAPGTGKNTLAGLDELKRALWARADNASGDAATAYKNIHAAVRKTLEDMSPEYAALMDEYQSFLDQMNSIKKTMGAGTNVDANVQLARAMRAFKTPGGMDMMDRVAGVDPSIPYKVAGAALNQNPTGIRQAIAASAGVATAAGAAFLTGDPYQMMKVAVAIPVGIMSASPRVMGKAAYGAGRAAAGVRALADMPGGPVTVGDIVSGASKAAYPAALGAEQLHHAQMRSGNMDIPDVEGGYLNITEPGDGGTGGDPVMLEDAHGNRYGRDGTLLTRKAGGRVSRRSGGRIASNPIGAEVKKVRALLSHKTASMLSMPDDAVATALHIAKGQP